MTVQKPRIFMLDFVRALSIFLVCMGHSVEQTFHFADTDVLGTQGVYKGMLVFMVFTICRYSVPFFFFLTGYLFLPRTFDTEGTIHFWKHNFLRLLGATEFFIILYNIFDKFFWNMDITVLDVLRQMVFLENVPAMDHYWYLPTALGIYLFLPIIANGLKHIDARLLVFPVGIVLVVFGLTPSIGSDDVTILEPVFTGGIYGAYVLLGYMVHEKVFRNIHSAWLITIAVLLFLHIHVTEFMEYILGYQDIVWYSWFSIIVSSACVFELFDRRAKEPKVPDTKWTNAVTFVARYSFAVYLVHFPLTQVAVRVMYWYTPSAVLTFLVATIVPFFMSLLITWLVDKIPYAGKYLLYMR